MIILEDHTGRDVRLTDELRESDQDESVHLYHRRYTDTPVSSKDLLVVVKVEIESPFVITAFYTDRLKSGTELDIG